MPKLRDKSYWNSYRKVKANVSRHISNVYDNQEESLSLMPSLGFDHPMTSGINVQSDSNAIAENADFQSLGNNRISDSESEISLSFEDSSSESESDIFSDAKKTRS